MATWGIWLFVIGRRRLTSDLRENGVKTLVCVCVCVCVVTFRILVELVYSGVTSVLVFKTSLFLNFQDYL
jgi:hypothetical protein